MNNGNIQDVGKYIAAVVKPFSERDGDRDSGGRSLRYLKSIFNFIITHSPSVSFADSSLPEEAL